MLANPWQKNGMTKAQTWQQNPFYLFHLQQTSQSLVLAVDHMLAGTTLGTLGWLETADFLQIVRKFGAAQPVLLTVLRLTVTHMMTHVSGPSRATDHGAAEI